MDIDLKRLEQVLTVARTGSISEAAQELHITQPALSRSIAALEDRYSIRIFERDRAGARLTEVGKLVVEEAGQLLRQARAVDHNFKLYRSGEAGRFACGLGPLLGSLILPSLAQRFLRERPGLQLQAVTKSAEVLYQELQDDQIEILFCGGGQLDDRPDVVRESVGHCDITAIVRTDHPLARRRRLALEELSGYPVLSGVEMAMMQRDATRGAFVCDNYHILRDITLDSDAVWISSPQFVVEELREGRLKALPLAGDGVPGRVEICMVYRQATRLSPVAEAVRDHVRNFLATL